MTPAKPKQLQPARCPRCGVEFSTRIGLGLHMAHLRKAAAKGRRDRICPDRRSDDEARRQALLVSAARANLRMMRARRTIGSVEP